MTPQARVLGGSTKQGIEYPTDTKLCLAQLR